MRIGVNVARCHRHNRPRAGGAAVAIAQPGRGLGALVSRVGRTAERVATRLHNVKIARAARPPMSIAASAASACPH